MGTLIIPLQHYNTIPKFLILSFSTIMTLSSTMTKFFLSSCAVLLMGSDDCDCPPGTVMKWTGELPTGEDAKMYKTYAFVVGDLDYTGHCTNVECKGKEGPTENIRCRNGICTSCESPWVGAEGDYKVTWICDGIQNVHLLLPYLTNFAVETNWASDENTNWTPLTKENVQKEQARIQKEQARILAAQGRRRLGWKPSHDIQRRREGFHHLFNPSIQESTRYQES